jgi:hypothetical protein
MPRFRWEVLTQVLLTRSPRINNWSLQQVEKLHLHSEFFASEQIRGQGTEVSEWIGPNCVDGGLEPMWKVCYREAYYQTPMTGTGGESSAAQRRRQTR